MQHRKLDMFHLHRLFTVHYTGGHSNESVKCWSQLIEREREGERKGRWRWVTFLSIRFFCYFFLFIHSHWMINRRIRWKYHFHWKQSTLHDNRWGYANSTGINGTAIHPWLKWWIIVRCFTAKWTLFTILFDRPRIFMALINESTVDAQCRIMQ